MGRLQAAPCLLKPTLRLRARATWLPVGRATSFAFSQSLIHRPAGQDTSPPSPPATSSSTTQGSAPSSSLNLRPPYKIELNGVPPRFQLGYSHRRREPPRRRLHLPVPLTARQERQRGEHYHSSPSSHSPLDTLRSRRRKRGRHLGRANKDHCNCLWLALSSSQRNREKLVHRLLNLPPSTSTRLTAPLPHPPPLPPTPDEVQRPSTLLRCR